MMDLNNWHIENENKSHWSFDNGVLSMQVQEGNIFGAGKKEVDNIFIYPVSASNYSAEVTISLTPTLPFEQAGLGIYWDNNNYVKISKEMFMNVESLVFVIEQNGEPEIKERVLFDKETATVKIEKNNGLISAYFHSETNANWQLIGRVSAPVAAKPEQGLMLYTFSGNKDNPKIAKFTGFQQVINTK